jgi:hypothetical protein
MKLGGEGLGTMFVTAGGSAEEMVEVERVCVAWGERNHVQARTKG